MAHLNLLNLFSVALCFYFISGRQSGLVHTVDNVIDNNLNISASRVCKPGPRLTQTAKTTKKCLIIGDSVSIGYTPWVETSLQNLCQVYHAPWDTADGGALDTKYAVKCLQLFLVSNLQEKIQYDVIVFNFGLHDVNFDNHFPEEFTDEKTYRENLLFIKESFQATVSKVGYILTTPIPYNVTVNDQVKRYNMIAREVMARGQPVPTADLYNWVVLVCGEPPYNSCVIADRQPSPHYTRQGYKYLSVLVDGLIRNLTRYSNSNGEDILTVQTHEVRSNHIKQFVQLVDKNPTKATSLLSCKDKTGKTVTKCPQTMTCSPSTYSMTGWGCCPLDNAVSCKDGKHCCPAGYECDPKCTTYLCFCIKEP